MCINLTALTDADCRREAFRGPFVLVIL